MSSVNWSPWFHTQIWIVLVTCYLSFYAASLKESRQITSPSSIEEEAEEENDNYSHPTTTIEHSILPNLNTEFYQNQLEEQQLLFEELQTNYNILQEKYNMAKLHNRELMKQREISEEKIQQLLEEKENSPPAHNSYNSSSLPSSPVTFTSRSNILGSNNIKTSLASELENELKNALQTKFGSLNSNDEYFHLVRRNK